MPRTQTRAICILTEDGSPIVYHLLADYESGEVLVQEILYTYPRTAASSVEPLTIPEFRRRLPQLFARSPRRRLSDVGPSATATHDWAWTDPTWSERTGTPERRCIAVGRLWPCDTARIRAIGGDERLAERREARLSAKASA